MSKKRIFISFAMEDRKYRDFLVGQSRLDHSPFEFVDMSVKQPWASSWKTQCRTKIKGCDGVIVLLSKNTYYADGARWEIKCSKEEGIPMIGMYVSSNERGINPPEISGNKIIEWSWANIKNFINSL